MHDDVSETIIPVQAHKPSFASAPTAERDLSREIEQAVEREPMDRVRCVRVFGNFYRCNWWSRLGRAHRGEDFDWAGLITDHVRKSRFFSVTMQTGQMVIADVTHEPR